MTALEIVAAARELVALLQDQNPFDATVLASDVALHADVASRWVLAAALTAPFPLVGDDFIIDVLAKDPDGDVRAAARKAASARGLALSSAGL